MKILKVIFSLFILSSCNDIVKMDEESLKRFPEIATFVLSNSKNFNGTHNLDLSIMEFSYEINESREAILNEIDINATKYDWQQIYLKKDSVVYVREYQFNEITTKTDTILIRVVKNNIIHCKVW